VSAPAAGHDAPLFERGYRLLFVLRLCLAFAAGAAVLYGIFFYVLSRPLTGDYAGVFHALRNLSVFLRPVIATSVLVYVLLVCGALCVYGLHKVAGPLYRMERVLDEYRSGSHTRVVSFRAGDQIEPLAHAFNAWIGKLRHDRRRWIATMEKAERVYLQDEAISRARMEAALREIETDLSRYR
jgi:hypothetical protein